MTDMIGFSHLANVYGKTQKNTGSLEPIKKTKKQTKIVSRSYSLQKKIKTPQFVTLG